MSTNSPLPTTALASPDSATVEAMATLAKLNLTSAEAADGLAALQAMTVAASQIQSLATDGVQPYLHPEGVQMRLRPDEPETPTDRATLQALAPATEAGLYLVPRVIE